MTIMTTTIGSTINTNNTDNDKFGERLKSNQDDDEKIVSFVATWIQTKTLVIVSENDDDGRHNDSIVNNTEQEHTIMQRTTTAAANKTSKSIVVHKKRKDGDDDHLICISKSALLLEQPCAICMKEFKDGDELAVSHNPHCHHYFHKNCAASWILATSIHRSGHHHHHHYHQ